MSWLTILKALIVAVTTFISSGIPLIVALLNARKAYKEANTEAEKEKAYNDLKAQAQMFIEQAEQNYKDLNRMLKAQGSSAGGVKKESVITKLQSYALTKGYAFDVEFWNEEIDEIVNFTKEVNGKK